VEWERDPIVAVTVARKFPASEPVQSRVEVPEPPVMVEMDRVQRRLVELLESASVTVPVKPFRGATVMVDDPAVLVVTLSLAGLAEIVKS